MTTQADLAQAELDARLTVRDRLEALAVSPRALILVGGLALLVLVSIVGALDVPERGSVWDAVQRTIAALAASTLVISSALDAIGRPRIVRATLAASFAIFAAAQLMRDLEHMLGRASTPPVSDVAFVLSVVPALLAAALVIRSRLDRGDGIGFFFDAAATIGGVTTILLAAFGPAVLASGSPMAGVLVLFPIAYLAVAVVWLLTGLVTRAPVGTTGIVPLAAGYALIGLTWVRVLMDSVDRWPAGVSGATYLTSIGVLLAAWGAATWEDTAVPAGTRVGRASPALGGLLPFAAVAGSVALLLLTESSQAPTQAIVDLGVAAVVGIALARQAVLVRERRSLLDRELVASGLEAEARQQARETLAAHRELQGRHRQVVEVFERLGHQLAFAADEDDLIGPTVAALGQLVPTRHGGVLFLDSAGDRLIVRAAWGWQPAEVGSAIDIESPLRCPGIRRESLHYLQNAGDPLQLGCPGHPARSGSVVCVPLVAVGGVVGVIHLGRSELRSFSEDDLRQAARIADLVALALADIRLTGQVGELALTDEATGLHSARFFEAFLERSVALLGREGRPVGVMIVGLDDFDDFLETYGRPAGGDAIQAFARVVARSLRESDTVARYGRERVIAALPGADRTEVILVAEKLRQQIESLDIEMRPGRFPRLTASIGLATHPGRGADRRVLVRAAEQAFQEARAEGRGRIVAAPPPPVPQLPATTDTPATPRRRRRKPAQAVSEAPTSPTAEATTEPAAA